ncbi:glycosyltransferase [Patiriisocius hiemis]|uniref:Glycosyltransferase n=1 Tax=Patiriisocius hiemis TaxID=3075604 RepID=A0ABU2YEV2_9FLAO|nr:glycosyltransferase [Constantimarinum sp. W242]MDT0556716.1 glycosyltransferase [Constantimarinum sp. W242]
MDKLLSEGTHIKICIVTISLANGGAERAAAMQSQMFTSLGHEVHIVTLNNAISYNYSGTLFNLGKFKKGKDTVFKRFIRFKKLRRYIKKQKFDVIVDNRSKTNYKRELFYSNYIYKNQSCIYVVHSSNKELYFSNNPKETAKIYRRNTKTVCVSKYIEDTLLEDLSITNGVTIYNSFNPDWSSQNSTLPKQLNNRNYILSYGRIVDSVKDFSFLINSFSKSAVWKDNIYLVIMGDGQDAKMLQNKASKLECSPFIIFMPFQENPFPIIKQAKFVTLTSKFEGFPMVLLESFSVGTPVAALDIISGPNEIIKHKENGLLVSERNVPLFSNAIRQLVYDKELYIKCKGNTNTSIKEFSMEVVANKWNGILLENYA